MVTHRPPLQVIAVREKASGLAASCLAMARQAPLKRRLVKHLTVNAD